MMAAPGAPPYEQWAHLYDALLGRTMARTVKENFRRTIRRYRIPIRSVADVGCGTGEFVRYLRALGLHAIGVDRSASMIQEARRRNRGNGAILLRQDLRRLRLPGRVHLITCNFDVLNYLLTPAELERAFRRFRGNLTAGGHLIFDMVVAGTDGPAPARRSITVRAPGIESVWQIAVEPRTRLRRVRMRHRFGGGGDAGTGECHVQRAYTPAEVTQALARAGFSLRGVHPFVRPRAGADPPRLLFVAVADQ